MSVSERQFRSTFFAIAFATGFLEPFFYQGWRGLSKFEHRDLAKRLVRSGLIFIMLSAVLLVPALAAELKTRAPNQHKKQSESYPSKQDLLTIEKSILLLTNNERNARGLPALQGSSALTYLARRQSENMCAARSLEHESEAFPNGWKKFTDRMRLAGLTSGAENIGYRTLREEPEKWATAVVNEWMKSPPHRKNILNPRWRYLGVGIRMCANRIAYAAQVFSSDPGRIR
ncbi:MAG: CAP domain-containing protein [Desulfomonilaceae bacterium]